ncbi:GNAT family N-acetyltransferase [Aliikangiella maris]|uniref:GNAT family N-acetyltransferase n=2 Tax=Aliikangiella maris TaxID=3162458 RepID=A0ABV3MN80_9GAMM
MTDSEYWKNTLIFKKYTDEDIPFMLSLYESTRMSELAVLPLSEAQKNIFIEQQFFAQLKHYVSFYNNDCFYILYENEQKIGRLFVDYSSINIRVVDISLLPEKQCQGLGNYLFNQVIFPACATRGRVSLHVDSTSRAVKFYERLGFKQSDSKNINNDFYQLMTWQP